VGSGPEQSGAVLLSSSGRNQSRDWPPWAFPGWRNGNWPQVFLVRLYASGSKRRLRTDEPLGSAWRRAHGRARCDLAADIVRVGAPRTTVVLAVGGSAGCPQCRSCGALGCSVS
jgi:hypothetical protein